MIAEYKKVRKTVQLGSQYQLVSNAVHLPYSASESVAQDKRQAVLFADLHSSENGYAYPRLFLQGLDPSITYAARSISGKLSPDTPAHASGAYWRQRSVDLDLRGGMTASAVVFEANR